MKIQVKAAERLRPIRKSGALAFRVLKKDLHHWLAELFPVILVVYDASIDVAYWEYIQRHFESRRAFSLKRIRSGTTVRIDPRQVLKVAAIRKFAKFKERL